MIRADASWLLVCLFVGVAVLAVIRARRSRAEAPSAPAPSQDDATPVAQKCAVCGAVAVRPAPLVGIGRPVLGVTLSNPLRTETDPDAPLAFYVDHEVARRAVVERWIASAYVTILDQRAKLAADVAAFNGNGAAK